MGEVLSPTEQQSLVNLFLEVAVGQTAHTARQFLQATSWNLEEAIQLFYIRSDQSRTAPAPAPALEPEPATTASFTVYNARDNLADLYRPPFDLMSQGPFEKAKEAARVQNKWLLLNVQSTGEFNSHLLNRDTWANEVVVQTLKSNYFIFLQVYDDTQEGKKVCAYYKLLLDSIISFPIIMVIDPVTGQNLSSWRGMVLPETLLENLLPFMDGSPMDHHLNLSKKRRPNQVQYNQNQEEEKDVLQHALAASLEGVKDIEDIVEESEIIAYPPLPDEPKGGDRNLVCRVGVRLPDGHRFQRNFLRSDPVQLLWSFVYSQLKEEAKTRPFRLTKAIPGSSESLDYSTGLTFEASGIANSVIAVVWV